VGTAKCKRIIILSGVHDNLSKEKLFYLQDLAKLNWLLKGDLSRADPRYSKLREAIEEGKVSFSSFLIYFMSSVFCMKQCGCDCGQLPLA
jgi:hypothetical protein